MQSKVTLKELVGVKIMVLAVSVIAFACAAALLKGSMTAYVLVGTVFVPTVIRFLLFCGMEPKES